MLRHRPKSSGKLKLKKAQRKVCEIAGTDVYLTRYGKQIEVVSAGLFTATQALKILKVIRKVKGKQDE